MSILALPEIPAPYMGSSAQNATIVTQGNSAVTSANISAAAIVEAPKTGNVSKVFGLIGTVSSTPVVDFRLETLSGQFPSGTLLGTNSNNTQAVANNTGYEVTLTTPVAVTKGQKLAIVITYVSGGTTNVKINNAFANSKYPYGAFKTGGTYAAASTPVVALGYDDGTYPENYPLLPAVETATTFNVDTVAADERGNRFSFDATVYGCAFQLLYQNSSAAADFSIVLYDTDGTSVMESIAIDADQLFGTSGGWMKVYFTQVRTFVAGGIYRAVIKPTTSTDNAWVRFQAISTTLMQAMPGNGDFKGTARVDGGAWSDTDTDWYPIGVMLSGVDSGSGGVSGSRPVGGV